MFTSLKMHKNASSVLEICFVAFFFFFFEHENLKNQTCLWRENSKQTDLLKKSSCLILAVLEEVSNV